MTDLTNEEIKTGKVKIRAGYETRVLATDLGGSRPVCIAFKGNSGWRVVRLTENGKQTTHQCHDHDYDLVRIPQPQYFNIHTGPDGRSYTDPMCGSIDGIKDQAFKSSRRNWSCETFKYINGVVTKIEPEEHE